MKVERDFSKTRNVPWLTERVRTELVATPFRVLAGLIVALAYWLIH